MENDMARGVTSAPPAEKRTKSSIIREALKKHPNLGPSDLAATLEKENPGLKVQPQEVSAIKTQEKKRAAAAAAEKERKRKREADAGKKEEERKSSSTAQLSMADALQTLRDASSRVGGVDEAKRILDLLR